MKSIETAGLASWEPVAENRVDTVTPRAAAGLHGLLDAEGPSPGIGDPLPLLWHWLAFLPDAPQSRLGPDGHPTVGRFLPPTGLPRRMFAGGRIDVKAIVAIGQPLQRHSLVKSVAEKSGRSGKLVFVEVVHELSSVGPLAITEIQDLVYRGEDNSVSSPRVGGGMKEADWTWGSELRTDPIVLFRFSALTYNAHRIHYDRAYAMDVEGYPGLVVHGPLQAVALAELCRRCVTDRSVASFAFRALRPAFDGAPLRLRGRLKDDDNVELAAFSDDEMTMSANVSLRPKLR